MNSIYIRGYNGHFYRNADNKHIYAKYFLYNIFQNIDQCLNFFLIFNR